MKNKLPISSKILIGCLLITISLIVYQHNNPRIEIIKNHETKKTGNLISMMIEQDDGSYEERKENTWPGDEYVFNAENSKCENGSEITFEDGKVKVTSIKSDKCYAYFDLKKTIERLCKNQEFASCVVNNYQLDNTIIYHNTEALANTNIANKELSANDNSYRYSGASNIINNFVCLDGKSSSGECQNGDADLYRIIGFFPNKSGEYEMKLIKYDYATKEELGDKATANGGAYYGNYRYYTEDNYKGNNAANIAGYYRNYTGSGTTNNMWQKSNLNQINLNQFYLSYITTKVSNLRSHITEHDWTTGGFPSSSIYNAQQVYNKELGEEKLQTGANNCYDDVYTTGARACKDEDLTYPDEIGLMYVSDYGYAAYPEAWNQYVSSSSSGYGSEVVRENNWMYMGLNDWTISRRSDHGFLAFLVGNTGYAGNYNMATSSGVRPTFYLDSSTKITSGDGSKTNPYRLSW